MKVPLDSVLNPNTDILQRQKFYNPYKSFANQHRTALNTAATLPKSRNSKQHIFA